MARPSVNLRLFVAVYPPRELAEAWARQIKALTLPPYRLTPPEQVHMTVQFAGDTPVKDLDRTIESCRRATKGLEPFMLKTLRLIKLPERGRSRLIAVETDSPPTLLELKRRLAMRLASDVRDTPEKRFRPHLTLCRFRSPSSLPRFRDQLPNADFAVDELLLMRSKLKPAGAVHELIERCALR